MMTSTSKHKQQRGWRRQGLTQAQTVAAMVLLPLPVLLQLMLLML